MAEPKTYRVQLVQNGVITAGAYRSPDGRLPEVGQVIPADDHGGQARVTDIYPDDPAPIRAELLPSA